jgi:hypothetical protein
MAKLVYGLNQSLDGYVDHQALGPPDPSLFRHFAEQVRGLTDRWETDRSRTLQCLRVGAL